jgi:hypothetical protein
MSAEQWLIYYAGVAVVLGAYTVWKFYLDPEYTFDPKYRKVVPLFVIAMTVLWPVMAVVGLVLMGVDMVRAIRSRGRDEV